MKTALIYPPSANPTAPYLSVPALTGYLRSNGVEVVPIDANIGAYDRLLQPSVLKALAQRVQARLTKLQQKPRLNHTDQLLFGRLWRGREAGRTAIKEIRTALEILRDRSKDLFFDPACYESALITVEAALSLISAAYAPLSMDFICFRTPFALLNASEIQKDARPNRNPFHDYFCELGERLAREQVRLAGISIAFPGQIQPAYALAYLLKRRLPELHLTVGGPAITQILVRLNPDELARGLGPFDTAVLFEGEQALLKLSRAVEKGERPAGVHRGEICQDLKALPAPDFDGLPLDRYLSPGLVLPYDPTRGCYWGKCAFCHYGLAEVGTARYRERPIARICEHLKLLTEKYDCRTFHFSQDTLAPRTAQKMARAFVSANLSIQWASDMRPEPALSPACCRDLADGGALALALGIESGAPRILNLMQKGIDPADIQAALSHLAEAGIATEAMCFTDFPGETYQEAMATIRLLRTFRNRIALFICGEFSLTPGARTARYPKDFGLAEVWQVSRDEFIKSPFFREKTASKTPRQQAKIDEAVAELSASYWLHNYPWAGSLSTAHTLLWYARYGPAVFRHMVGVRKSGRGSSASGRRSFSGYNPAEIIPLSETREIDIWETLNYEQRAVSRSAYHELADQIPPVFKRRGSRR